jgi:zinc transporter ZupT
MLTALVPSIFMGVSSYLITLNDKYSTILKSFSAGLLLFSGFNVLNDKEDNKTTIISFIISLVILFLIDKKKDSLVSSLYFDSISDGLLLGSLFNTSSFKELIPLITSLSIEMSITGVSAVDELRRDKEKHYKEKVLFSAVLLGVSILFGYKISRNINKDIIYGMGAASMLWLSIGEFMTKIKIPSNVVYIFVGIIVAMIFE